MTAEKSLSPDYFEGIFAGSADPWGFETSPYERAKQNRTIAALAGRRYGDALEIGCANGVLTRRLSGHAQKLLALDVSDSALARARDRCADLAGVAIERMAFPRETPADRIFDLVVISEVAYYWSDRDLALAGAALARLIAVGGDLLLVHWTGETDYPQTADGAVAGLGESLGFDPDVVMAERTEGYRLDLWRRR